MPLQTDGIKKLLDAEKKAAEKVNEARRRKTRRLKEAKEEATREIEKYRADREEAFREYEKQHIGNRADVVSKIEQSTRTSLDAMHKNVYASKEKVIEQMLEQVICHVEPQLHRNYRKV